MSSIDTPASLLARETDYKSYHQLHLLLENDEEELELAVRGAQFVAEKN